ncbi:Pro-Pol polyprotein [Frankliniella fusca]|uniref:RNA-directed DNA polymerase n=1 Tax=Frankliniella fusca TaxID=407009 RepID=A0AAE1H893_9NEOP|nr:Pro-Pol polyprotein [Frankliniella fusca]
MSAGIAREFRNCFGIPQDLDLIARGVGDVAVVKEGKRYIFHLITKPKYYQKPNPLHLKLALHELKRVCLEKNIKSLAMPRIGCGLDGLFWHETVKPLLLKVFKDSGITIEVYRPSRREEKLTNARLIKIAIRKIEKDLNREYRTRILQKFGDIENYRKIASRRNYVPTELELRAWAEHFFLSIPVTCKDGNFMVGCKYAYETVPVVLEDILSKEKEILRKGEETARDLGTTTVGANRKEEMPGRKREGSPTQYEKKEERRKPEPAKGKGESSLKNTQVATYEGIAFTVESGKHERDGGKIPEESMDPNELMMAHFEIGKTLWVHKIKGPDSNLFSVAMKIEGEERRVTVDSAASKSLVSINLINKEKLLPCAYEIIAANDMALDLLGQVTLQISSEGEDWVHTFLVHNQKSPALEILLGNDFHDKFGTDISFRKNQCTIRGKKGDVKLARLEFSGPNGVFALKEIFGNSQDIFEQSFDLTVHSTNETVLEAGKDSKIKIEVGPYKPKTLMHFKPKDIFGGRIMPWEILLYPDEDEISVTNIAPFYITLPKDTKLGSLGAPQGLQYTKDTKGRMPQALVNLLRIDEAPSVKQKKGENSGHIEEEKALNINPALKEDDKQKLNDLLEKYEDVFVRPGNPLQITNILKVRIPLKDPDKVIYQQNYPIPPALDKSTTKVISDLIKEDVLEPAPHSNYRIPFMIVEKGRDKNNQMQYRLVLSAKKLNECLASINYSPPKIDYVLAALNQKNMFSTIDLVASFHQLEIDERDRHILSIQHKAFIKDFHKISKPILNAADPAEEFSWGPEQREAVKLLHKKLLMDVTLMHFNADLETVLACDGSPVYGVGAVLYQKCPVLRKFRPVAVYSKQFPKSQRNSSAHDAELLALYYSLQRFRMELHAVKEFTIETDCISLQFLDGLSHPSARQARVQIYLTQFYGKYKLKYKPGRLQTCPDFHSRNPDDLEGYNPLEAEEDAWKLPDEEISRPDICKNGQNQSITLHGNEEDLTITAQVLEDKLKKAKGHVFAVTRAVAKRLKEEAKGKKEEIVLPGVTIPVKEEWRVELMKAQASDKGIKEMKRKIENGDVEENCIIDGIVYKFRTLDNKRQPVIIVPSSLRKKILENCHDSILGGHYGVQKTLALIESTYWWQDMKKDTRDYVKSCQACGEFKPKLTKDGLLQPIIATRPFQIMGCDFMEMGTSKQGCRWGFALVDLFSGFVYVKPSKRNRSRDASHAFKDLLGIIMVPEVLICDRGPHFTATDFQEFVERLGVKELNIVPPRVHQSNGAAEAAIKRFKDNVKFYCKGDTSEWQSLLPFILKRVNESVQSESGRSPCELMYGVKTVAPGHLLLHSEGNPEDFEISREKMREKALQKRIMGKAGHKKHYDKNRKELSYQVNEEVFYGIEPLRKFNHPPKLQRKFRRGRVISQVGPVTYEIQRQDGKKVVTSHVALMKKCHERPSYLR